MQLQTRAYIKLVTTTDDPEAVGFIRWRNAFYAAGDVQALLNLLLLLGDFWFHVSGELSKEAYVVLYTHSDINIDGVWDYLLYDCLLYTSDAADE